MKSSMDEQSRHDLIEYRLKRAVETLKEADYNAKGHYYNAAVNRLYYACYYAASALMLNDSLDASTHKGVRSQLGLHYINPGKLDPRFGSIYSRLYQARQDSDYEDFVYADENMYADYKPQAAEFIQVIKDLIK